MVRLTIPGRIPAAASHFPLPIGSGGKMGKVRSPKVPVSGTFGKNGKAARLPWREGWRSTGAGRRRVSAHHLAREALD